MVVDKMKTRVISACIMVAIIIPFMIIGGIPYSLLIGLLGIMAFKELTDIRKEKKEEFPLVMRVIGLLSMLLLIYSNFDKYGILFGVSYKALCGVILIITLPVLILKEKYTVKDSFDLLGYVLFLGIGFNLLISVYNYSIKYFILLILITTMTDTFAYVGGKLIGKHKFTKISPNKTIEGCIIGSVTSTFIATTYYINVINSNKSVIVIILSILFLSIVDQCGDLFFSAIKREYNKKDFSNLIPGHGGILDRLDSIIFVLFAFLLLINIL